jgi:hypothetical protein
MKCNGKRKTLVSIILLEYSAQPTFYLTTNFSFSILLVESVEVCRQTVNDICIQNLLQLFLN